MTKKAIFSGDRNWNDVFIVDTIVRGLQRDGEPCEVIEGEAHGLDVVARAVAQARRVKFHPVPADWRTQGRSAGPIRNRKMLDMDPDYVICFHDRIEQSAGTWDMAGVSIQRGKPVYLVSKLSAERYAELERWRVLQRAWYWIEGQKADGRWFPLYCAEDELKAKMLLRAILRAEPGSDRGKHGNREVEALAEYEDFRIKPPSEKEVAAAEKSQGKRRKNRPSEAATVPRSSGNDRALKGQSSKHEASKHGGPACDECGGGSKKVKRGDRRLWKCVKCGHTWPRTKNLPSEGSGSPSKARNSDSAGSTAAERPRKRPAELQSEVQKAKKGKKRGKKKSKATT